MSAVGNDWLAGDEAFAQVLPQPTRHSRGKVMSTILHRTAEAVEEGGSPTMLHVFQQWWSVVRSEGSSAGSYMAGQG
jgi:hypothetical protein